MNDTIDLIRQFASTTTGQIVLAVVGLVVLASISVPLWRSIKYAFKALMWILLVALVLLLGAVAIWVWMKRDAEDPARLEAVEREAVQTLRQGWTNTDASDAGGGEPVREE